MRWIGTPDAASLQIVSLREINPAFFAAASATTSARPATAAHATSWISYVLNR
jgi:hypothetical protein